MTADATETIQVERAGCVLRITFNRPHARNAMTFAMYDRLRALCEEIDADEELRVVVLTGAGDRAFVAGTDISEFLAFRGGEDGLRYEARMDATIEALERVHVPTIAVIRGACTGGGAAIAAACDLRIAAPSARIGFPVARTLGNCLSIKNYARLANLVGVPAVKEMVYTARLLDADRALRLGFLNEVVAEDALLAYARDLATLIAGNAPLTIRATKEAFERLARDPRADGTDLIARCYGSSDFREGMTAFLEKRAARWTGR